MRRYILSTFGMLLLLAIGVFAFAPHIGNESNASASYGAALIACRSYPNGSAQQIVETSRVTIYLPKALYPNQAGLLSFTAASGTATADLVSNAGLPGNSYGASSDCFAYYYEFDGQGEVDLNATSSVAGVPNYSVRFLIKALGTSTSSSQPPSVDTGKVSGVVQLGPTCPVERMPPDPQCAPKPYKTSIFVSDNPKLAPITTTHSAADGTFTVSLAPGSYTLTAGGTSYYPHCSATQVSVSANKETQVTINCDTGIR